MRAEHQGRYQSCRLIVSRGQGNELLVRSVGSKHELLCVHVPYGERFSEYLMTAARKYSGSDAVCLFWSPPSSQDTAPEGVLYHVLECVTNEAVPASDEVRWVPFSAFSSDSFTRPADYEVVRGSLSSWARHLEGHAAGPFAVPGWFQKLQGWVERSVKSTGYELKPDIRQLNATPDFSLIRFQTSGPAVWFKAVGEPNLRELPITLSLGKLMPGFLPEIIAVHSEWKGWLAVEAAGTPLGSAGNVLAWKSAAGALAQLQIGSMAKHRDFLNSGAHDLRFGTLLTALDEFMDLLARVMERQAKLHPPALTAGEIQELRGQILDAIEVVRELGIPDTLGSLDLGPNNVIVSDQGCKFLDWAEAYVGHPFFSLSYLVEHFRREPCATVATERQLSESYELPWTRYVGRDTIADSIAFAPFLASFAYALAMTRHEKSAPFPDSTKDSYLRALGRRMKREADQLVSRRSPCLVS